MAAPHPLGALIEIAWTTTNAEETMRTLSASGIGPWKVFHFNDKTVKNHVYEGAPAPINLKVCFATLPQNPALAYEIIQPLDKDGGGGIFAKWLRERGGLAGIHHLAYDCRDVPWIERFKVFEGMGARFVQGGTWVGRRGECKFAWFEAKDGDRAGTYFETIEFSEDWEEPDEVVEG